MAEESKAAATASTEGANEGAQASIPATTGAAPESGEQLTDKHGEPAISKGRYEREMKSKDDEIAALKAQLEEAGKKAETGADALKRVEALEAQLADEKVTHALEVEGCVNAKAAKALLDDYKGDVAALKADCPYLFRQTQTGSTGARPNGAPTPTSDDLKARAKAAAQGKLPNIRR